MNALDSEWGSIKVEGKGVWMGMAKEQWEEMKVGDEEGPGVEYLDLWLRLEQGEGGRLQIRTSIFRKAAAADLYLHASSAHPRHVKLGMMKGERIRFLTRCSTKEGFDGAWERFRSALMTKRGYKKEWVEKVEKEVRWEDREARHTSMDEKREARVRGEQAQLMPGLPIIIPDKAGVSEWWARCVEEGLVGMQGLHQEARDKLPGALFRSLKGTAKIGQIIEWLPAKPVVPRDYRKRTRRWWQCRWVRKNVSLDPMPEELKMYI
jgi:hypothetical protein